MDSLKYFYIFLVVLLAACALPTEDEILGTMQARCESYGFEPGTVAMAECVQRERLAKESRDLDVWD